MNLHLIGQQVELLITDVNNHHLALEQIVNCSKFLVLGGAGSIG